MNANKTGSKILAVILLLSVMPVGLAQEKADDGAVGFSANNMDRSADPRKDFYRYAAGAYLDKTAIPPSESRVGPAYQLSTRLDERLLEIVKRAADAPGADPNAPQYMVGNYYRAGMNVARLDELGMKPIQADLDLINAADSPAALVRAAARLELTTGGEPLLSSGVGPDLKNNKINVLQFSPGTLGLKQHEYLLEASQKIRDLYVAHVANLFELAGDSPGQARVQAATVLAIEHDMAAGSLTPQERADPRSQYHPMTIASVRAFVPALDFDAYFGALGIEAPESVVVRDPKALFTLQGVLAERPAADIRTLLLAYLLRTNAPFLGSRFSDPDREFNRKKDGLEEAPTREKTVLQGIQYQLGQPLSRLYVKDNFPESSRAEILGIVERVKGIFRGRIEANQWLAQSTRATALKKLENIQVSVGYPDDKDWIDYSGLVVTADDYVGNVRRITEFTKRQYLGELGKPVRRDPFSSPFATTPISVNAGLYPQFNVIEVTAGISQAPFYVPSTDMSVKFGSIGAVVGHEMTHGFDSKGRFYDPSGNLTNWWTDADAAEFQKRANVLVKQYDSYEVIPGVHANGTLTLAENIADLGGLTIAYYALQDYMKEKGRLPAVDGMTPEQRFFVAFAQVWMSKSRPEAARVQVATDPHSPSSVRAFGPAVNMPEFFEAFGIKAGDPMWKAPEDRVRIW